MSDFVTTERFEDHLSEQKETHNTFHSRLISLETVMGTKVSWSVFWSIFALTVGLFATTFGVLYAAVKDVQTTSSDTKSDVSYLRGKLERAEIK